MITYIYRIADKYICIKTLYDKVHLLCKDYRVVYDVTPAGPKAATYQEDTDFAVQTTQADIDFEREKSARDDEATGIPVRHFSDAYLETLAVYRKIAEAMPFRDTLLLHGSTVAVDGAAYTFIAKSGTGKSTHTKLWRQLLGDRAVMVNDDKPLVHIGENGAIIYGTPWDGKHHLSSNIAVPLKAVCILERAEENSIRPVTVGEAYPMLLQQIYRPMDGAAMAKTMELIDRLAVSVGLWRLGCNRDIEAAEVAYSTLSGAADAATKE